MRLSLLPTVLLLIAGVGSAADATTSCATACSACLAVRPSSPTATERAWYIGPKGGDIRKGAVAALSAAEVATAPDAKPWYMGPKGGDVRKGGTDEAAGALSVAPAVHCARCAAERHGQRLSPKGGGNSKPGSTETACAVACSR